jgi:N-acetylneuraminic acid mutarotase
MYPAVENQVITFGGYPVEVLEGTATTVKVKLLSGFPASNVTARIDLGELLSVSSQTFELISPWRQLKDFPVANLIRGYSFVLNGVAYVGGIVNGLQYFYRYNQGNDSWISETPTSAAGFYPNNFTVVNNGSIALVGLPQDPGAKPFSNDFYEYDAATKQWISAGKFPNETPYTGATGFAFANAGYVTNGLIRTGYIPGFGYAYYRLNTTYKFDFATRVWTEVERSPNVAQDGSFVAARSEAASFTIGDNAYIFGGIGDREPLSDMIIFNNVSNSWSHRTTTLPARGYASGFSIGQFGFLVGGSGYGGRLNDCWKFNPNTGEWTQVGNFPGPPRYDAISFVLNGKAYFGLGNGASSDLKDFWEFDPSKL